MKERDHWEDLDVDGSIIFKRLLKEYDVRLWTRFSWLRTRKVAGSYEETNEPSGSVTYRELRD
jgi:hypothetical protein